MEKRAKPNPSMTAIVLGAGTVGLSAALLLKERVPEMDVTIVAAAFFAQTTSYGSGGYWMPYALGDEDERIVVGWGAASYRYFLSVLNSPDGCRAGISLLPSFQLYATEAEVPDNSWRDAVCGYRHLSADEVQLLLPNDTYRAGFTFNTVVATQSVYMQYLTEKLTALGVRFVQKRLDGSVHDFLRNDAMAACVDVVVNCCGLAGDVVAAGGVSSSSSSSGVDESRCFPIRGQVLRVKAPWVRAVWGFGTSYIIPNQDNVVLGGTAQRGDDNTVPTLTDSNRILCDIARLFPSLKHAPVDNVWVGLRPGRGRVRCGDGEVVTIAEKKVLVTHCYGHGGSGITLAYGCASDVVDNHVLPFLERKKIEEGEGETR